jgi:predicted nucleic acid-binding protein
MFVFRSERMRQLERALTDGHHILLCRYVVDELRDVVERKFPVRAVDLDGFLRTFPFSVVPTPRDLKSGDYPPIRDEADLPVLASAIVAQADILVTGDADFSESAVASLAVMTPGEFIASCERGQD